MNRYVRNAVRVFDSKTCTQLNSGNAIREDDYRLSFHHVSAKIKSLLTCRFQMTVEVYIEEGAFHKLHITIQYEKKEKSAYLTCASAIEESDSLPECLKSLQPCRH